MTCQLFRYADPVDTPTAWPWLDQEQQTVWRAWLDVAARLPAALHRDLQADSDLSLPDFDVLVQLTEHPEGRMRASALAHALAWERSRLSHHVGRMERRGLLAREECDDDGRGAWVVVTDGGRAAIERAAPAHVATVRDLLFDALTPEQVSELGAIMATIGARLDAH